MDLQSILPLLMKNGNNADLEKILSLANGKNNPEELIKNFLGKDAQSSAILSLLKNNKSTKRAFGLEPIKEIANDEIFGRITKFFLN